MNINPIRAEAHYKATLDEVSSLMQGDPDVGTPEGDRLDVLVTLVQAYEGKHYPIDPPADPLGRIAEQELQPGGVPGRVRRGVQRPAG